MPIEVWRQRATTAQAELQRLRIELEEARENQPRISQEEAEGYESDLNRIDRALEAAGYNLDNYNTTADAVEVALKHLLSMRSTLS